jgi:hypothetical protein
MKKFAKLTTLTKATIALAVVFAVATAGFIATTVATTGFNSDMNWGFVFDWDWDWDTNAVGGDRTVEFAEEEVFSNLDLRVTSAATVIRQSADGVTRVSLTASGNRVSLEAEIRGGTLFVDTRWARTIGFQWNFGSRTELTIELPERQYEQISIRMTSGSVDTRSMSIDCDVLNVRVTSGKVHFTGTVASEFSVDNTSGSITLQGVSGRGNVKLTSGDVTLHYADWNDSLRVRATSGNFEAHLPEGSGIRVNSRVTSGRADYRFGGESGRFDRVSNARFGGDNVQDVEINLTSGNVRFISD